MAPKTSSMQKWKEVCLYLKKEIHADVNLTMKDAKDAYMMIYLCFRWDAGLDSVTERDDLEFNPG